MPSGAKKRKAAKKKMQKEAHNHNNGHHSHGSDDPKPHDDRESDGGEVEREASEEVTAGNNHEHGTEKMSSKEENLAENCREVDADDTSGEFRNGNDSEEHKSSSSSSSDEDEVEVKKDNPVVAESVDCVPEVVSVENPATSVVVVHNFNESVPVEEAVKEMISLPQDSNLVSESVPVESTIVSDVVESGVKQGIDEVSPPSDEQRVEVTDLVQEKSESKVIPVVGSGLENSSISADTTSRENEVLLPKDSGVTTVNRNGGDDHVVGSEKLKDSEKQPLISSVTPPVRRASWMNCCGLLEVFSGGSG